LAALSDVDEEVAPRGASVGSVSNHKHASKGAGAAPMANDFIRGANSASVDVGRYVCVCVPSMTSERACVGWRVALQALGR